MKWEEIRQQYPHQWLLVEVTKAHKNNGQRVLEQMAVIGTFTDSITAMQSYAQLHHDLSERELYVCHTAQNELDVIEREGVNGGNGSRNP